MKILNLILILFLFSCNNAENKSPKLDDGHLSTDLVENPNSLIDTNQGQKLGHLTFTDTLHDFGKLLEGEIVEYDFDYINDGKADVIITEAKASCGCTVPDYETKPIAPGEKATLKVKFNSQGKKGYNEKHIDVVTNAEPSHYTLIILSEVN